MSHIAIADRSDLHYKRLYRLLSELSERIFALSPDFDAICREACRIAVETGGYRFAFVALLDPRNSLISPNFQFGIHQGYLTGLRLSYDATLPEGQGPTGIAVRSCGPVIVNDVMSDPLMSLWRDNAKKAEIRAVATFPLLLQNRSVFGVFNIYADKANPFDVDEIDLLGRLALHLAMAYQRKLEDEKRRVADEDRLQAQIRLSGILQMAGDAIVAVDESHRIQLFNKAAEDTFGWSASEIMGATLDTLIPKELVDSHDHHMRAFAGQSNEGLQRIRRREVVGKRKDGSLFPASNTFSKLRFNGGWVYIATIRDISAAKVAESKLLQLHAELERGANEWRHTFDALASPILICTSDLIVRRLNEAALELTGLSQNECIGKPLNACFTAPAWMPLTETAHRVAATNAPAQSAIADPVSGRKWHLTALPWQADATQTSIAVIAYEVTEILALQESLRHTETMSALGQLIAGVSHEVRNPLFGMSATLDAFELKFGQKPEFTRYVESLRRELTRMSDLVRDLLDYGKPMELAFSPVALASIVKEATERCASIIERKRLRIDVRLPADLPPVTADLSKLTVVLKNLIENAAQHTPAEGSIEICADRTFDGEKGWVWCQVRDSGPGIPAGDLADIFRPFFTRRQGGTGLGLSIVQRVIEKHGGIVKAANRPEGGAEFSFGVPHV